MTRLKTAIIGLGITGTSSVRYLHGVDELLVLDTREEPPGLEGFRARWPDVTVVTGVSSFDFTGFDRVLVSPGVALDSALLAGVPATVPLVSDIDLFCEAAAAPVLAVTGTNGKSTVTSLVGHLLRGAGRRAVVGGNLGEAALDLLDAHADVYVLELSSFQLERMAAHRFEAATILNVTEDHLDRHGDMAAYRDAKRRIYRDCGTAVVHRGEAATVPEGDCLVVSFGDDAPEAGDWGIRTAAGERWLARGEMRILPCPELPLAGGHNELNVLAALALVTAAEGVARTAPLPETLRCALADALRSFAGLPHRCRRVADRGGVTFINDSKATNVGATRAALLGLGRADGTAHIVLIAGGDGKGADFTELAGVVGRFVKALVLLGRDASRLAEALAGQADVFRVQNMGEAVRQAAALAAPGDLVLLSPACASLDMYANFAARGEDFEQAVAELAA